MNRYERAWTILHEEVANKAIRCYDDFVHPNDIYGEISAKMASVMAGIMCDDIEKERIREDKFYGIDNN